MTGYDDELEEKLRRALPVQTGGEEYKMELKQRLLSEPLTNRQRTGQRRGIPAWAYGIGGIAAVLVLALLAGPVLLPGRNLPKLPPLDATGIETQGASAGPGFTVELALSDFPTLPLISLPDQASTYRYGPMLFSPEAVQATAAKLGITGAVSTEAWQDANVYSIGNANTGALMLFPDGYQNYHRNLPDELTGRSLPAAAELTGAAEAFLAKLGITPAELKLKNIDYPDSDRVPTTARLFYVPDQPANIVSVSPYIMVTVGADREIYGVSWVWLPELQRTDAYPLRKVEEAWADLKAGQGELVIEYRDIMGPVEGTVITGTGKVEGVNVGYLLTYDASGEVVLQPVYAFSGTATLSDGMQLPFTSYTRAVAEEYYRK
jgi:hypothetical protein